MPERMSEPFTDEELENIRLGQPVHRVDLMDHEPGICYYCRFLATIAARDKRIEEMENNPLFRVDSDGAVHQVKCENCAALQSRLERMEELIKEAKSGWSSADNIATGGHAFYRHEIYHDWLKRCQALNPDTSEGEKEK